MTVTLNISKRENQTLLPTWFVQSGCCLWSILRKRHNVQYTARNGMTDKLGKIWKEAVLALTRNYTGIYMQQ